MQKRSFIFTIVAAAVLAFFQANPCHAEGLELEIDFAGIDTNSDGKISKEELGAKLISILVELVADEIGKEQAEQLAKQAAPQLVEEVFRDLDRNLDGFLTEDEV